MPRQESIERNKGMVLQALAHKVNQKFKTFCKTDLMDRFLHACIDYFARFFALQKHLGETQDEAAKTGQAGPARPAAATVELEEAARAALKDVATIYAAILVKYSNYANTQQERQFFETLYDFSARVLFTINDRKKWHAIENELGRIFRSDHFNLSTRKNEQSPSKLLRFKELYELKQQGLGALAGENRGTHGGSASIHVAMHLRSPIVSSIFPTPKERMAMTRDLQQALKQEADADEPE